MPITLNLRNNLPKADPTACKYTIRDGSTVAETLGYLCASPGSVMKDTTTGKVLADTDVLTDGQTVTAAKTVAEL